MNRNVASITRCAHRDRIRWPVRILMIIGRFAASCNYRNVSEHQILASKASAFLDFGYITQDDYLPWGGGHASPGTSTPSLWCPGTPRLNSSCSSASRSCTVLTITFSIFSIASSTLPKTDAICFCSSNGGNSNCTDRISPRRIPEIVRPVCKRVICFCVTGVLRASAKNGPKTISCLGRARPR